MVEWPEGDMMVGEGSLKTDLNRDGELKKHSFLGR